MNEERHNPDSTDNPLPRHVDIFFTFLPRSKAQPDIYDCFFSLRDVRYADPSLGLFDPGCLDRGDIFEMIGPSSSDHPTMVAMLLRYKEDLVEWSVA